jgi:hypothetical protein
MNDKSEMSKIQKSPKESDDKSEHDEYLAKYSENYLHISYEFNVESTDIDVVAYNVQFDFEVPEQILIRNKANKIVCIDYVLTGSENGGVDPNLNISSLKVQTNVPTIPELMKFFFDDDAYVDAEKVFELDVREKAILKAEYYCSEGKYIYKKEPDTEIKSLAYFNEE